MDTQSGERKHRNMVSPASYSYVDQLQGFAPNSQDIYNLATGMEHMITFPPKNHLLHHQEFFSGSDKDHRSGAGASSSRGTVAEDEYQEALLVTAQDHNPYAVDDSSLKCVFPCEGNERPSQGLSLSLSSANPSAIVLQPFELRDPDGFFPKSMDQTGQQNQDQNLILEDESGLNYPNGFLQIRGSKYLGPAQDLLNEFCNLGSKEKNPKVPKPKPKWGQENDIASGSKKQHLYALEILELQKRKTKLLAMLEEVDRRYRHYCHQMKVVVSTFEAVAGNGAATIYSEMASKAMSRHFRGLRDGIVAQIKETKKAMGEKDTSALGMTRGETPRLRILDQMLRQQRAFQQMGTMESHPWRPQRGLPERSVSVLRAWLFEHFLHPYPSDVDKHVLARQTGLSRSQVSNWFINARVRLWKPMVEEMYIEETKEQDNLALAEDNIGRPTQQAEDQKPSLAQLGRLNSECLSSIIINPNKSDGDRQNRHQHQGFNRVTEPFGQAELDFSTYGHHHQGGFDSGSGNGSSGGVSLTLGLQQHGENGVSLAFNPTSQGSLFYPRDHSHLEDCQTVQFSLVDGEAQNLPYRNLMGAQLLHDLAG